MSDQIYTGYSDALNARIRELEIQVAMLTDKCAQLMDGRFTRCALPSCDNVLLGRLALGYTTCSVVCHQRLKKDYAHLAAQQRRPLKPAETAATPELPARARARMTSTYGARACALRLECEPRPKRPSRSEREP